MERRRGGEWKEDTPNTEILLLKSELDLRGFTRFQMKFLETSEKLWGLSCLRWETYISFDKFKR